jgi:hypothetical protein
MVALQMKHAIMALEQDDDLILSFVNQLRDHVVIGPLNFGDGAARGEGDADGMLALLAPEEDRHLAPHPLGVPGKPARRPVQEGDLAASAVRENTPDGQQAD